jgi:2-keto-4-pentenoate hydratase
MTTARRLCDARAKHAVLPDWPGDLPTTLEQAYRLQKEAITCWGQSVAGWKVGLMVEPARTSTGVNRWLGPAFGPDIVHVRQRNEAVFTAIRGVTGFECELMLELAVDVPSNRLARRPSDLRDLVRSCLVGIEITGCPVDRIGELGSLACIAAFGNNAMLLVGPEIDAWRSFDLDALPVRALADGKVLREASPASLAGGVWGAFADALDQAAAHDIKLQAGTLVSTGAITGLHLVEPGSRIEADFGTHGQIVGRASCKA